MPKLTSYTFYLLILSSALCLFSCSSGISQDNSKVKDHKYTNALINETSPYLLQHAHNPVNWMPWGKEASKKSNDEDKLMIISVGYSSCHWCHVMEHESFEDSTVAAIMNDKYVSIKVDREERPDVDQIYMTAAYLTNGRGGWPLNAIALPDGRPVFGGTYFPKDRWMQVLTYFIDQWENNRSSLEEAAAKYEEGIKNSEEISLFTGEVGFLPENLDDIFNVLQPDIDFVYGGKTGAPKFPMPNNYDYLLHYAEKSGKRNSEDAVMTTLNQMAWGGIYDHLGGGFSRYSVDAKWVVPHFEKMLYDNGQLVSLYSMAYQKTKNPHYKKVVQETLEWVKREMTDPSGGFYSALDADSEGVEGKFYVWTEEEIDAILGEKSELFKDYYSVSAKGNFEHKNILLTAQSDEQFLKRRDMGQEELLSEIDKSKQVLMKERDKRIRPGLDDKALTSWNALMLKGYIDAYNAFGEKEYLDIALKNARFIDKHQLNDEGHLFRNFKNDKSNIDGFLDDYSLTIEAFIAMYQATFDETWLYKAKSMADYCIEHFFDPETKMFFYTSNEGEKLIARKKEIADNVIPGSNSSLAKGLFYLGEYFYSDNSYKEMAEQMLKNVKESIYEGPRFHSNWAKLMLQHIHAPYQVAIVGPDAMKLRNELARNYLPDVLFMGGENEGSLELLKNKLQEEDTYIYVCQYKVCKFPVRTVSEALDLIK